MGIKKPSLSLKNINKPKLVMLFMAGVLLCILSFPNLIQSKKTATTDKNTQTEHEVTNALSDYESTYITEMENKLESMLRKVSDIGEVKVMITIKSSKVQVPLKDTPTTQENINETDGDGGSRINSTTQQEENTIIVTDENGNSLPYIIQEYEPEIEGILVIAQGGDSAFVKMDIMETAMVLFDVPAHKVKVMKMQTE